MANLSITVQKEAALLRGRHSELRYGQSLMIALSTSDQKVYRKITGTVIDCFYNDDNVEMFLDYLNYLDKQE